MASFKFSNGQKVISTTSGFKGKVTSRSEALYGCNRYYIQPPVSEDGKLPDGYWHDEVELEAEDQLETVANPRGWKFNLGDKVESLLTRFKGVITTRSEHQNGCMRYVITPKGTSKKLPEESWSTEGELILIEAQVLKSSEKKEEKKTGGPVSSFK